MTNPPTKILLALLTLALMIGAASAQQRTLYDASQHCGEARCEADVVGAVEPADDGGTDGPHAEVDFLGDSQSSRRRSTLARDRPRHPRAQAVGREAQALGL